LEICNPAKLTTVQNPCYDETVIGLALQHGFVRYISLGAITGLVGGLFGVGGGIVLVPLLAIFLRQEQHVAQGTSLGVVALVAVGALVPYLVRGHWDWPLLGGLAAGALLGVVIGAKAMVRMPPSTLRVLFALLMLAVAARLLIFGN
jgi:uncharacterized membrane protein YfcA